MLRSQMEFALLPYVSSQCRYVSLHCRELLLLVGIWDNVSVIHTIVGNADLTVLHSAVAIISAPVIKIGSKTTSFV